MRNKRTSRRSADLHLSKEEYLAQLRRYFKRLPKEDYDSAMEYFTECFEEAGPEGEAALMEELGTPKEAAWEVLNNLVIEKRKTPNASPGKILGIAVLAICAAPVGGALAVCALALLLCCVLVIGCCLLSAVLFGGGFIIIGIKMFIRGIIAIRASLAGASLISGAGLLGTGLGLLLILAVFYLCRWLILCLTGLISNIKRKRSFLYNSNIESSKERRLIKKYLSVK